MVEPFPESFDASVSAWQWPGAYPYAAADSAYTNFLACLKALYIGVSILILFKLRESEATQYCVHGGLQQIKGSLDNSLSNINVTTSYENEASLC